MANIRGNYFRPTATCGIGAAPERARPAVDGGESNPERAIRDFSPGYPVLPGAPEVSPGPRAGAGRRPGARRAGPRTGTPYGAPAERVRGQRSARAGPPHPGRGAFREWDGGPVPGPGKIR